VAYLKTLLVSETTYFTLPSCRMGKVELFLHLQMKFHVVVGVKLHSVLTSALVRMRGQLQSPAVLSPDN